MADKKISALTSASALASADVLPIVQNTTATPVTRKISVTNLMGMNTAPVGTTTLTVTGSIVNSGSYVSYKNSTNYIGYLYVPLSTPLTSATWTSSTYNAGTYTIDTSASYSAPANIKAVALQFAAQWSGASSSYYMAVRPKGGSTNVNKIVASVASYNFDGFCTCPCDASGDIDVIVSGSGVQQATIRIWGYYI